jgi:uncharacterized membrane protein
MVTVKRYATAGNKPSLWGEHPIFLAAPEDTFSFLMNALTVTPNLPPAHSAVVAIYKTHQEAEAAVKELHDAAFDMTKLSIIGRDYHTDEHSVGYYNAGDRIKFWGATGAFWGGMWGLLFGSAFFWIPVLGPFVAAGPLVGWIIGVLEGAVVVGGVGAFGAALASVGIPNNSVLRYESALMAGKFVLLVHGTTMEVTRAIEVINATQTLEGVHFHTALK